MFNIVDRNDNHLTEAYIGSYTVCASPDFSATVQFIRQRKVVNLIFLQVYNKTLGLFIFYETEDSPLKLDQRLEKFTTCYCTGYYL